MFCTYAHTKPDGTIFYIGKGSHTRAHSKKGRNKHWNNIVNKYGSFGVDILANWDTEEEAFSHEILLISCFRDMGYVLANHTIGGEGPSGYKWSEEQLKNHNMMGKLGNKHPFFGKKRPEVSKKLSGKNNPMFGVKRFGLNSFSFKGTIVATNIISGKETKLVGQKELEEAGFQYPNVTKCIQGKRKTHKGHTFKRIEK
jgi:hypothetical protein